MLLHLGGMQSTVDHPGWDASWPTPSEYDIDDLADLGLLRVEPTSNKQRTFVLTIQGTELASEMMTSQNDPQTEDQTSPRGRGGGPSVFVSWAHGDAAWEATIHRFVSQLYAHGVEAEVDLFHLHSQTVNWADYGPQQIQRNDHVLIAASESYKRRWDGTEDPTKGAGAALEANVLKSIFSDNRDEFIKKVKIVVLPGATEADIPLALKAVVHRFHVDPNEDSTLEHLVRTLTGQPAFVRPTLAEIPDLPPKVENETQPPSSGADVRDLLALIDQLSEALAAIGNGYLRTEHAHLYGVILSKVKSARPRNEFVGALSEPQETAMSGIYRPTSAEAVTALTVMRSALATPNPESAVSTAPSDSGVAREVADLQEDMRRWIRDRNRALQAAVARAGEEMNARGVFHSSIHLAALAEIRHAALHEYRDEISRKRRRYRELSEAATSPISRFVLDDVSRETLARWRSPVAVPGFDAQVLVDDPTAPDLEPDIREFEDRGDGPKANG
jgi:hypothetical protein